MEKRIWGVLAGGALGDSMGMPTECWSQKKIREKYPNGIKELLHSDNTGLFKRNLESGSVTDDTINTLFVLEMIVKNKGKIDVNVYLQELIEWINNSELSSYVSGPSTVKAVEKINSGVPIEKAGVSGTTNGAAMKIAPVGLISDYRKMNQLVKNVWNICLPTHNTKIAVQGASMVAACISYVVQGGKSIENLWKVGLEALNCSKDYGYDFPCASLEYRLKIAKEIVDSEKDDNIVLERLYDEVGSGVEIIETIPCVFALIQLADGNPVKVAQYSAAIGWDTDTIGAISTAICGGMYPEKLPQEMIKQIESVNRIDFSKLTRDIRPFVNFELGKMYNS